MTLAHQIPERHVHRACGTYLRARALEPHVGIDEVAGDALDLPRVLAQQVGRDLLVDDRLDRLRSPERLPEARQAFVGFDLEPEKVRALGDTDRAQRGDARHGVNHRSVNPR